MKGKVRGNWAWARDKTREDPMAALGGVLVGAIAVVIIASAFVGNPQAANEVVHAGNTAVARKTAIMRREMMARKTATVGSEMARMAKVGTEMKNMERGMESWGRRLRK